MSNLKYNNVLIISFFIFILSSPALAWEWLGDGICRNWHIAPELYYFEYPVEDHWSAVAVSPMIDTENKDIQIWDNPDHNGSPLALSDDHDGTEFVIGDFTASSASPFYPEVIGGTNGTMYVIEWDHGWNTLAMGNLVSGNVGGMAGQCGLARVWDLDLENGESYLFTLTTAGSADIRMALFRSSGSGNWYARSQSEFEFTSAASPYTYEATADDTYGVIVFNNSKEAPSGSFDLRVDQVQATEKPDLIVQNIEPQAAVEGQNITVTVTVKNQGPVDSGGFNTTLSKDGVDVSPATKYISGLTAGNTATLTWSIGSLSAGNYTLEAEVDSSDPDQVDESIEGNNTMSAALTVNASGLKPDLYPISIYPETAVAGQSFDLFGTLYNGELGAAGASFARFRIDGLDYCTGIATPAVDPHFTMKVFCTISSLTAGQHTTEFCVDTPNDDVDEIYENNNCMTSSLTITPAPKPDLIVDTIEPQESIEGQPLTVTINVTNRGAADAGTSTTRLSIPKGGVWDISTPAIAAGQTISVNRALGTLAVAGYLMSACADRHDVLDESVEFNNCRDATLTVKPLSIVVYPDGSGSYSTIQSAIDAVAVGGYVILADGTFTGDGNRDLDFKGKTIHVNAQYGASPVIDCESTEGDAHRGFYFHTHEGPEATVYGITIANGRPSGMYPGGGVNIVNASPTFEKCTFSNCGSFLGGGVAMGSGAEPRFIRCTFTNNIGGIAGGGLLAADSSPTLEYCLFTGNTLGGAAFMGSSFPLLKNCSFYNNDVSVMCDESATATIENSIMAFENEPSSGPVYCVGDRKCADLYCCDLYGNAGGDWVGPIADQLSINDNQSADPLFCDAANGNLSLHFDSICMEGNNSSCGRIGALTGGCPPAVPRTFVVKPDGSGDFPTIGAALAQAWDGDTIELTDGIFTGENNCNFMLYGHNFKALTIRSQSGNPMDCIIDCEGDSDHYRRGFMIIDFGSGPQVTLEGFTIRNGFSDNGAGITCYNSSPDLINMRFEYCQARLGTGPYQGKGGALSFDWSSHPEINNCSFLFCSANYAGGAVYLSDHSSATMTGSIFYGNTAEQYGGCIYQEKGSETNGSGCSFNTNYAQEGGAIYSRDAGSTLSLTNCYFGSNQATGSGGAIYERVSSSASLSDCTFAYNNATYGGGMYSVFSCQDNLEHCTFYGNSATTLGGALRVYTDSTMDLDHCLLWGNTSPNGPQIGLWSNATLNVVCSDIQDGQEAFYMDSSSTVNWGANNLDEDPLFCNAADEIFNLHSSSQCAAENNSACGQIGAWPIGCGPFEILLAADGSGDYPNIIEAVDAAWDEVTITLQDGIYTGANNKNINPLGKAITIQSQSGNPDNCIIDLENSGRGLYIRNGEGPDTIISGLTIQNGNTSDGAGIFCNSTAPTIHNCKFINNQASNGGGGIRINGADPVISQCLFQNNHAFWGGGGIYSYYGNPSVTECRFDGNNTDHWGAGIHTHYTNDGLSAIITDSTFINNTSGEYGGGSYNRGGASPEVTGCTFINNLSTRGGAGMYNKDDSSPKVINCIFRSNQADTSGGGICNAATASPTVANTIFADNFAGDYGGGMHNRDTAAPLIINNTFVNNTADIAGGALQQTSAVESTLINSILWGNEPDEISGRAPDVSYSNIDQNGFEGINFNIRSIPMLANISDSDPANWDYHLLPNSPCIDAGDNTALPVWLSDDFEYDLRILDGDQDGLFAVDIGADEYTKSGLTASYSNGIITLEGPINHGWSNNCVDTMYNLYQNECIPNTESPVNWAMGPSFSVNWQGDLYAPAGGDYHFGAWVDGDIYIEINGTIVADFNTTGGSYSAMVTLDEGTWVPVDINFASNGGSNNMRLSWTPPGGSSELVPKRYLRPTETTAADFDGDSDVDGLDLAELPGNMSLMSIESFAVEFGMVY